MVVEFMVRVVLPLPGEPIMAGENPAETRLGMPNTAKAIGALNPLLTEMVKIIFAGAAGRALALVAVTATVKVGTTMVSVTGTVRVREDPRALTVRW